ncbi:hypothetical protein KUCAC02_034748 [Chaenocephalus aceratus]|nr:hypothetical protein KUCAC02_034748 [Chaenocephalus aceratus]
MTLCLALEDVEALYLGPSFLTADPMGPLLDHEDEEALSPSCYLEGKAPPPRTPSPGSSTPRQEQSTAACAATRRRANASRPFGVRGSPEASTRLQMVKLIALKVTGPLFSVLPPSELHVFEDDAFAGMDWMSEKIDLSELGPGVL